MDFKTRLRELRLEKNVTQADIARLLHTSKMAISHWEKGDSEPSIDQLKTLVRFFDVSVDWLIGYSD